MEAKSSPCPSRKVCLYLGDIAKEVDKTAAKLGISRSQLLVRAWSIAKDKIAATPALPVVPLSP